MPAHRSLGPAHNANGGTTYRGQHIQDLPHDRMRKPSMHRFDDYYGPFHRGAGSSGWGVCMSRSFQSPSLVLFRLPKTIPDSLRYFHSSILGLLGALLCICPGRVCQILGCEIAHLRDDLAVFRAPAKLGTSSEFCNLQQDLVHQVTCNFCFAACFCIRMGEDTGCGVAAAAAPCSWCSCSWVY